MLKQDLVHEVLTDITTGAQLPPLNNLPQWSRINTLDKARYPKPFLKDRLQPLPNMQAEGLAGKQSESVVGSGGEADMSEVGNLVIQSVGDVNTVHRIQHLEKSIHFLQVQHQEVLANLHDEIDKLRRENKELQFRIIMLQRSSPPATSSSQSASRRDKTQSDLQTSATGARHKEPSVVLASASSAHTSKLEDVTTSDEQSGGNESKNEELKVIFLEDEVKELKRQLTDEKGRNNYLTQLLQQAEKQKLQSQQLGEDQAGVPQGAGAAPDAAPASGAFSGTSAAPLPYNATMVPLQVRLPHKNPRPPTLAECEVIIRHLQQHNDRQAHELNQLKADLRDVLYSHKWTPDAYLLAKAYVAQDDAKETVSEKDGQLPRIPLKQPARKLPDIAYIQRDAVTLPALKQTMGNKAIERRKRAQIMQKSRVRREVMPNAIESTGNSG